MFHLVFYRDFAGKIKKRSYAGSSTRALSQARMRCDCAAIIKAEPITEADHKTLVATQADSQRVIRNCKFQSY
jgi:hypothetical protein